MKSEIARRRPVSGASNQRPDRVETRRHFLGSLIWSMVAGIVMVWLYTVLKFLNPPKQPEPLVNSVTAASVGELKPNSGKIFPFGTKPAILINTPEGKLRAFTAICTHLSCTVQYRPDLEHIWCACHNGHYDLNGINIAGPPPRPLTPYEVKVQGDKIWVVKV